MLLLLGAHLLMTGLPGAAAALAAARRGVTKVPVLLATALAVSGAVAMLGFWMYFAEPSIGKVFSWATLLASIAVVAGSVRGHGVDRAVLGRLATPLALWALGSSFLVFLGFVHGGTGDAIPVAAYRFSSQVLPSDNDIPRFFAAWFYAHGHSPQPPVYAPNWLFSDRPPLQVGYVLIEMPFGWDGHGLNYELVGVVLQQLWIVGLWALLVAAGVGRVTRALTVVMVLVSDVAIVNGFFVWPKLLPAAMLLAAAALLITSGWSEMRRKPAAGALIGALFALAMLGHGSSVFGIIPLALIAALRGLPSWRWLAVAVLAGVVLLVPWSEYQKNTDPPGNRLTKWMLAGMDQPDNRSTADDILMAYRDAGLGGNLHDKAENFVTMAGGGPMVGELKSAVDSVESGDLSAADGQIRTIFFFKLLPSFGLLLVVPLLMLIARWRRVIRSSEWTFALNCYAVVAVGSIAWGLLLFGNPVSTTVIHQGSFALPVIGFCAAVAGARATFPRLAVYLVAVNAAFSLLIYAPSLHSPADTSYFPVAIAVAAVSLAGFGVVAFRGVAWPRLGRLSLAVTSLTFRFHR